MRKGALYVAAILAFCQSLAAAGDDEYCPLVVSEYDALVFVYETASPNRPWDSHHVYFFRRGRLMAERYVREDMRLGVRPGCFSLTWDDDGTWANQQRCNRIIHAREVYQIRTEAPAPDDPNLWWRQGRNMTDLEAPPPDPNKKEPQE